MSFIKSLSALALLAAALQAQAGTETVTATQQTPAGGAQSISFEAASLGGPLSGYTEAGVLFNGGWVYNTSIGSVAAQPAGSTGHYVAVGGPSNTLTVSFAQGTGYFSFLWGTADSYNTLVVTTNLGTYTYIPGSSAGLPADNAAHYFNWFASAGETVTGLSLRSTSPAFEVDNFAVAVVPEPANVAMLLAGLALIGSVSRRRRIG